MQSSNYIENVVTEKVNSGEMFTAYDVSKEVQQLLKDNGHPFERHNQLKDRVHEEMQTYLQDDKYRRNLQDVGAPSQAFVYYPVGGDPAMYLSTAPSKPTPSSPTSTSTPTTKKQADDVGDTKDHGRKTDSRGTLTVPVQIVAAAGFNNLETAYATPTTHNGKLALALSKSPIRDDYASLIDHVTTYTVDSHGNIRITGFTLTRAGIGVPGAEYSFDAKNGVAYVTLSE